MKKNYTLKDFLVKNAIHIKTVLLLLCLSLFSNSNAQCTNDVYGLYPTASFVTTCNNVEQTIVTNAYASEYSNVVISANRNYTFSSSITSDFITITNEAGTVVFTSGTTPLMWNSGANSGVVRYYLHTSSACGASDAERSKFILCQTEAQTCSPPSNLNVSNIFSSQAQLNWNAATPSPSSGYDIYYSTTNAISASTTPVLNVLSGFTSTITSLTPATTYYFWIRSNCQSGLVSSWVSGGSFTTASSIGNGCINDTYGMFPANTFTPILFFSFETIHINCYAGQYSKVNIIADKQYTMTSSVPTDFITMTNEDATVIYASGVTPLVWNSGTISGVIRYYFHTNSSCGSQQVGRVKKIKAENATTVCNSPSNLSFSNILTTSAQINWNAATPTPSNGYQIYYSNTNSITPTTTPTNSTSSSSFSIINLNPGTTYYYWVRSNCGSSIVSPWVSGGSFTTLTTVSGCISSLYGLYPDETFTPFCSGLSETIVGNAFASEYTNVNGSADKQYIFSSSISTDYITITNANASVVYASGVTPIIWNSGTNSGAFRYYLHTNTSCGSSDDSRAKYILCQNSTCAPPSDLTVTNIQTTSAQLNWNAASPSPLDGYDVYFSTINSITPTTFPSGNVTGLVGFLNNLPPSTTYYFWVRSNCGNTLLSDWVSGGSFTTATPSGTGCVFSPYGLYPTTTFTPACTNSNELIVNNAFTGEYSNVNITSNTVYTFTSSIGSDYITISNANASVIYASGISPLVWNSTVNSGVIRYYIHLNSSCLSSGLIRVKSIKCQSGIISCASPSNVTVSTIQTTSAQINWSASTPVPSNGYQIYYSINNSISGSTIPTTSSTGLSIPVINLSAATTYHFWVRSNCGSSNVSNWVAGGSFTTLQATGTGCTNSPYGLFPGTTFTPNCTGSPEVITTSAFAGSFTNVNIVSNRLYTFSSSIATDFITITNADASIIYNSGVTPLVWDSGVNSGLIRYYFHTNSSCDVQNTGRTKSISCDSSLGIGSVKINAFKLYPNPTKNTFTIEGEGTFEKVIISTSLGQQITRITTSQKSLQIDISNYSSGVYYVKVFKGNGSEMFKMIKE